MTEGDAYDFEAYDEHGADLAHGSGLLTQGVTFAFERPGAPVGVRRVLDGKTWQFKFPPTLWPGDTLSVTLDLLV